MVVVRDRDLEVSKYATFIDYGGRGPRRWLRGALPWGGGLPGWRGRAVSSKGSSSTGTAAFLHVFSGG